MPRILDLEQWWPELFAGMDSETRNSIVQAFAGSWHEGWEPNREDVENLTNFVRGEYDREEYLRRAMVQAEHS
ncbi:hypothetical protein [Glutamicibacter sp.]|uniref:antitoxin VbhA family protein n=1 Tax=Glutamicibacter sp. TaxID=1931995 RepID=UPI002B4A6D34|nr:hypothetical protein [Glutamicibacter sp.]HJX77809.1 hypothetical protein [Glutamicibacter sp.]